MWDSVVEVGVASASFASIRVVLLVVAGSQLLQHRAAGLVLAVAVSDAPFLFQRFPPVVLVLAGAAAAGGGPLRCCCCFLMRGGGGGRLRFGSGCWVA